MGKRLSLIIASALWLTNACGDGDSKKPVDHDAGSEDGGVEPDCYDDPKTYLEIINACTDAEKVEKNPKLPLLGADGKLPPLP